MRNGTNGVRRGSLPSPCVPGRAGPGWRAGCWPHFGCSRRPRSLGAAGPARDVGGSEKGEQRGRAPAAAACYTSLPPEGAQGPGRPVRGHPPPPASPLAVTRLHLCTCRSLSEPSYPFPAGTVPLLSVPLASPSHHLKALAEPVLSPVGSPGPQVAGKRKGPGPPPHHPCLSLGPLVQPAAPRCDSRGQGFNRMLSCHPPLTPLGQSPVPVRVPPTHPPPLVSLHLSPQPVLTDDLGTHWSHTPFPQLCLVCCWVTVAVVGTLGEQHQMSYDEGAPRSARCVS